MNLRHLRSARLAAAAVACLAFLGSAQATDLYDSLKGLLKPPPQERQDGAAASRHDAARHERWENEGTGLRGPQGPLRREDGSSASPNTATPEMVAPPGAEPSVGGTEKPSP